MSCSVEFEHKKVVYTRGLISEFVTRLGSSQSAQLQRLHRI